MLQLSSVRNIIRYIQFFSLGAKGVRIGLKAKVILALTA